VKTHYGADLELRHVSRFDSGVYLCLANNGVPPTVSKRVRLYVDCEYVAQNRLLRDDIYHVLYVNLIYKSVGI
jgi:hypothetical protein